MLHDLLKNWHLIVTLIVGCYEVIVRAIPTVGNLSIIGKLIELLKYLSDTLNVKK